MLRRLLRFTVVSLGLGAAGCRSLPDIQPGVCGNLIIDPLEDCDGAISSALSTNAGLACGLPGTATACRYDCTADLSAPPNTHSVCPAGFTCGADSICRAPSGEFALLASLPASSPHLFMNDFDLDGRADLVGLNYDSGELDVYFFDRDGVVSRSFSTPSDGLVPSFGELEAAPGMPATGSDVVIGFEAGVEVMRGQSDRSFLSTAYATIDVQGWSDGYVVATDALRFDPLHPDPRAVGDELLVFHSDKVSGGKVFCPSSGSDYTTKPVLALPVGGPWPARIPLGALDENDYDVPCDQFVLPDPNAPKVWIVAPCKRDVTGVIGWNDNKLMGAAQALAVTYPGVDLPAGAVPTGVLLAQLNPLNPAVSATGRDDHLDLLIEAQVGAGTQLFVAWGLGDGTFSSTVPAMGTLADNKAGPAIGMPPQVGTTLPLVVADFNADGSPDFVTRSGLYQSVPMVSPTLYTTAGMPSSAWSEAMAVDYNGDGALDLVAGAVAEPGIQLLTNARDGTFDVEQVATQAPATQFVFGDLDGDLNPDIAFRVGGLSGVASLEVMFGQPGDLPLSPRFLGQLESIDEVVTGVDLGKLTPPTAKHDLMTLTRGMSATETYAQVAVFPGRPDRALLAPYFFRLDPSAVVTTALLGTATGVFHSDINPASDVAALVITVDAMNPTLAVPGLELLRPQASTAPTGATFKDPLTLTAAPLGGVFTDMKNPPLWTDAVMAAVDVDKDGVDEVAILVPTADPSLAAGTASKLIVAAVDGTTMGFKTSFFSNDVGLGLYNHTVVTAMGTRRNAPLCVADIDGDKNPDLVFLASVGAMGVAQPVILWGGGSQATPFDTAHPTTIAVPGGGATPDDVAAFTCIDVDGDGLADLIMVTRDKAYVAHGSRTPTAAVMPGLPGGISVTTGNIDDDGLADLVISNATSATLYLGKATNP